MSGMLKAELFKFRNFYMLWVIIGVITASCGISIVTGTFGSAEQTLVNIAKDSMVPILACAVYGAIILTDDFSNGMLRHYIANGYKRESIIFAKLIHYILGCSILLLVYPCVSVLLASVLQGTQTAFVLVFQKMILLFVKTLPLYWGVFGLFFLVSILIQKGVIAAGVSVAVSILLVVFTNRLYAGEISVLRYSPIIQIGEVADGGAAGAYLIAVLVSLAVLAVCILGSMVKFKHDEL